MNDNLKLLIRYAILMALTVVMTMVVHIPTIGTNGYLNLGDMVVLLAALILGKKGGFVVGGLGSALADLLLGYVHYAPITLIVKGLEGYIAGSLLETEIGKRKPLIATSIAGIFMAFGYFVPEIFMYGKGAIASIPGNIMQGLLGAITSVVLYTALKRTKALN
ncbi:ECF transporter S component [Clostridium sp. Cult1]|uniref:ECF transporter S component n=1 Tax=Clostridium sp. Cult1 TaxID=2079002 RepID=UPI001F2CCF04|nr:ECF transporter S component [Clostridium sp. Cult1]MCF6462115.1 ECF transporter S component [Clostridium sp. Cult1]